MVKILVTKYGSPDDRTKQENGIPIGEATSLSEFTALVGQGGRAYLGYTDDQGERLNYNQVERRFGHPTYAAWFEDGE